MKIFNPNKNLLVYGFIFFALTTSNVSCDSSTAEDEIEEIENVENQEEEETQAEGSNEPEIPKSLIGSWRNTDFGLDDVAMSFDIDSLGIITYYRKNQLTGKFELLPIEKDQVSFANTTFEFIKSQLCEPPYNSGYELKSDTLSIALQRYSKLGQDHFVPVDFESYVGNTRPLSSMSATITNYQPSDTIVYHYDASSDYELVSGYYTDLASNMFSIADNEFGCHTPANTTSRLLMATNELINGTGTYTFNWIDLQMSNFHAPTSATHVHYYNSVDFPLTEGSLQVTFYEEVEDYKYVEGTFSFSLEADIDGKKYRLDANDGSFDLYIKPNPE